MSMFWCLYNAIIAMYWCMHYYCDNANFTMLILLLYWYCYCYNNVVITLLLLCHSYNATKADENFKAIGTIFRWHLMQIPMCSTLQMPLGRKQDQHSFPTHTPYTRGRAIICSCWSRCYMEVGVVWFLLRTNLGGGGIVLRLINRRPGDRRQHEQYFLPAPLPYTHRRAVIRSCWSCRGMEVDVVQCW